MTLPVFDREREYMFKDANTENFGRHFIIAFFIFIAIILFVRYSGKKERARQQYRM